MGRFNSGTSLRRFGTRREGTEVGGSDRLVSYSIISAANDQSMKYWAG